MTNKETIDRWAEQIIPTVFRAEDALQKAKPEWKERLKHLGQPGGEDPNNVAAEYCREIATIIVTQGSEYANDRLIDKVYHEIDRLDIQEREENKKKYPGCGGWQKAGNAIRFMNVAKEHDIETVGQLLEVGRARFEQFRNMGRLCADRVSEALDNLYGIKSW